MKEKFEDSGCVEWLVCPWYVYLWDVIVNSIQLRVVFSLGYFDGGWFLIRLQSRSESVLLCSMGCAIHGDSGEWLWKRQHECEWGNSYELVMVGTTTWLPGDGKFVSVACMPHVQGAHLLRCRRGWSVSFKRGVEGGILYSFTSLAFPSHCQVVRRCKFWHLFSSLWYECTEIVSKEKYICKIFALLISLYVNSRLYDFHELMVFTIIVFMNTRKMFL